MATETPPVRLREAALVLALSAVPSLHRFANGYVIDDVRLLVDHADRLTPLSVIPGFFTTNALAVVGTEGGSVDTYRPLAMATFAINHAMSGTDPWAYHLTNLLLHLAVVLALYVGVHAAGEHGRRAAPWAALAFGVHPLLAEAHVWINGRSDVLCALPLLIALHVDRRAPSWGRAAGIAALVALAGFGKEVAVPAAIIAALVSAARASSGPGRVARAAPWVVGAAIPIVARLLALDGLAAGSGGQLSVAAWRLGAFEMHGLISVAAPGRVIMPQLDRIYADLGPHALVLGWLAGIAGLVATAVVGRRRPRVALGLLGFGATLAPAVLITLVDWPGYGRYLYVPTAVLLFGVAPDLARLASQVEARGRRLITLGLGAWIAVLAAQQAMLTADYRDVHTFWGAVIETWPDQPHGWSGLGDVLAAERRHADAIAHYERAMALSPRSASILNNLGLEYVFAGRIDDAVQVADVGTGLDPSREGFYIVGALAQMNADPAATTAWLSRCLRDATRSDHCAGNLVRLATEHPLADAYRAAIDRVRADPDFAGVPWPPALTGPASTP